MRPCSKEHPLKFGTKGEIIGLQGRAGKVGSDCSLKRGIAAAGNRLKPVEKLRALGIWKVFPNFQKSFSNGSSGGYG